MPIIRKKLSPDELNSPNQRYNETSEEFEVWNGTEWVVDDSIDPRTNPANELPPRITADTRCDAAASMRARIENGINTLSTGVSYTIVGTDIFIFLASVLVGVGLIASFVLAAAQALVAIGITTLFAALTEAVYDELENIIYCLLDDEGQFTDSAFTQLGAELNADIGGDAGTGLNIVTQLMGRVGLNNTGAQGTTTGDCTGYDCEWFVEFDFTQGSPDNWYVWTDANYVYGGYNGGYFQGTLIGRQQLFFYVPMPGIQITGVARYADTYPGNNQGSYVYFEDITALPPAGTFTGYSQGGLYYSTGIEWVSNAAFSLLTDEGFGMYLGCDNNATGHINIYKVRLSGTGTPPSVGQRVNSLVP